MGHALLRRCRTAALVVALVTPLVAAVHVLPAAAANLVVTDGGDTGAPGQLRQVVAAAAAGDTITFTVPTVTLTSGEILIAKNLTIRGNGPAATTVTRSGSAPAFRIFEVASGVTATIDLLTVSGGMSEEGPQVNDGFGGGILNAGDLTVTRSVISGNTADSPRGSAVGGGLYSEAGSKTTISHSRVINNAVTAANVAEGGGIEGDGNVTVIDSDVSFNQASGVKSLGGGILAFAALTVLDSVVSDNTVATTDATGGVAVAGGIDSLGSGPLSVANSVIRGNTAGVATLPIAGTASAILRGGGVAFESPATIDRTEIADNSATGSTNAKGGGIYNQNGRLTLTNTTLGDNSADTDGGALFVAGPSTTTLSFATVAGNGSAGAAITNDPNATLTLDNSIVANTPAAAANCGGPITQTGVNDTFGTNGTCTGAITADPKLSPLAANGGINRTMALASTSPAINAASGCPASGVDQRGFPRNVGPCDIGAYEFNAVLVDTTPPACAIVGVLATNPKQMDVSVQDTGRGVQTINQISITNGTVVVPYFTPGTTQSFNIAAVKTDQTQRTVWSFHAIDQAGNDKLCT